MSSQLISARTIRTAEGSRGNALVVEDGVVTAIGDRNSLSGDLPERRYPQGILLPGLRDAHLHPVAYAAALRGTTLATARDFAEIVTRLERDASRDPQVPVVGMRLNEEALIERRLPTREVLDRGARNRPALVHRYCGHVAVANSIALQIAGITSATRDPVGGSIDRDADGEPTGVLRETAIDLVSQRLGVAGGVSDAELLDALHRLAGVGITSVGAILRTGGGAWASLGNEVEIAVAASDRMPIRVGAYVVANSVAEVTETKNRIDAAPGLLRWLGIKRFGDGSFGGHTAAMFEPFDDVATPGTLRLTGIDEEIAEEALRLGGGAAIHAIGDRACEAVIDMFVRLIRKGADARRLRIEHASVLNGGVIKRLSATGVVAVVQPPFLGSEAGWLVKRLGSRRLAQTYAFATMEAAGITMAGSSDCPVESPDPWAGMALAQDRAGMVVDESIVPKQALAMYTSGGATALGEPAPLAVGSPADLIVVDRDPTAVAPDELRETGVIATFVGGVDIDVDHSRPLWLD